ncbi:acyltransferase-domain protein [Rhizoctonia solani AG-3 Rhs1AP]|uniref:Tafazzin family protein n=1 Tax=Rhizoctonia solani AG-3 Rhs1AP TaxID=1086054 RepID=X8J4K3_9AGAM|nr:acyltransferase-domain protein [Rhizoctonia solani AG-3 Rhs1AP]
MSIESRLTLATVGLGSRLFLKTACASVKVHGLQHLLTALDEAGRNDRGIITVSNHISVVDDPLVWGALPVRQCILNPRNMRWTLGASDIMFTGPVYKWFFRNGQVIETVRGAGVHQPAVDLAVAKLNSGAWVHVFPEGQVNQESCQSGGELLRFKWGVGRMVMSTTKTPVIIPMHIEGLQKVMPEPRRFKFLPRIGRHISITFGDPEALTQEVDILVQRWRSSRPSIQSLELSSAGVSPPAHEAVVSNLGGDLDTARLSGEVRKQAIDNLGKAIDWTDEERARVNIVAVLQKGVADLALNAHPP